MFPGQPEISMEDSINIPPLVSVLMTAWNRQEFIAEAIESVLASTYTNFELIIVDDCSADNTVAIITAYEKKDTRIKFYVNEKNLGDYANRNRASTYASGEFIMSVDSDDMILQDGIENCVKAMLSFPAEQAGIYFPFTKCLPFALQSKEAIQKHFFEKPFLIVGPGATIIRRSFFEALDKYPEKYGPASDMYFNLKLACHASVLLLPFEFMYYRRHAGQEINNKYSYLVNSYRYLQDALKELPLPLEEKQKKWLHKKSKRRFTVNIIRYFFKTFDYTKTKEAIKKARFTMGDALQGIFQR